MKNRTTNRPAKTEPMPRTIQPAVSSGVFAATASAPSMNASVLTNANQLFFGSSFRYAFTASKSSLSLRACMEEYDAFRQQTGGKRQIALLPSKIQGKAIVQRVVTYAARQARG